MQKDAKYKGCRQFGHRHQLVEAHGVVIVQTVWLMGGDRLGGRRETRTETMSTEVADAAPGRALAPDVCGRPNAAGGIDAILMSRSPSRERSGERARDIPSHFVKRSFHSGTALECPCGAAARPYRLIVSRPRLMARRGTNTPGSRPQRRAGELAQGGNRMRNQPEASGCFRRMISLELWLTAHQPSVRWVVHQVAKLGRRVFTPPGVPRFVAYFRVSTEKQGVSGLGLDAQTLGHPTESVR